MKRVFNRVMAVLLCGLLLCMTVPAQLTFGPDRLRTAPAPTLRNRTRLRTALPVGRPRLSFVGRVGGVAFDGTATPAADLQISNLTLGYVPTNPDGERLSLTINGQAVSAPIYDWQLIPIAKFVSSDSYSCFTLFGDLTDRDLQSGVLERGGRVLNYHPAFVNTLMGLRLFQLDNLIISPYSWDLVKDRQTYVLGAGEQAPNTTANKLGLTAFGQFVRGWPEYDSYVISDNRRNIVFDVADNTLKIQGQPSYYFWRLDKELLTREKIEEALTKEGEKLLAEAEKYAQTAGAAGPTEWFTNLLITEARVYDRQIGNYQILQAIGYRELERLLSIKGDVNRRALLATQSVDSLLEQLILLRTLKSIQNAVEVRELSDKVSNRTDLLRAINPVVWDAGVTLLRYGAFLRYVKEKHPAQWQSFMLQIRRAPRPRPFVTTPTILEGGNGSGQ